MYNRLDTSRIHVVSLVARVMQESVGDFRNAVNDAGKKNDAEQIGEKCKKIPQKVCTEEFRCNSFLIHTVHRTILFS